jgi:Putative prokaryotic signal transducing protein
VEIIDRDEHSQDGLVQVAFAETREEAALIRGLLREEGIKSLAQRNAVAGHQPGAGMLGRSPRRILVHPDHAAAARAFLAEVMVEEPPEEIPEPANAGYLADAQGRKPRDYGLAGGYARMWSSGFALLALAFVIFLLIHGT